MYRKLEPNDIFKNLSELKNKVSLTDFHEIYKTYASKMGLLIFYPDKVMYKDGVVLLDFPHTWMNVKIDDQAFLNFMKDIDKLLEGPEPQASSTCKWCEYRESSRKPKFVTDELPF